MVYGVNPYTISISIQTQLMEYVWGLSRKILLLFRQRACAKFFHIASVRLSLLLLELAQELDVIRTSVEVDEYESYISQMPIQVDCSPLTWWLRDEQLQRYPRLSKMAINILSIPAMSADPERVFSGAHRTISWERMQLGASTIEKGECLKSWIRSGVTGGLPVGLVEQLLDKDMTSLAEAIIPNRVS